MRTRLIIPIIISILCIFMPGRLVAQQAARTTEHALSIGAGLTNAFDAYLSPLEYTGAELRLQRETLRQTTKMDGKLYVQTLLNLHASYSENPAKNANMYEGLLSWDLNYLYKMELSPRLTFLAGGALDLNAGAIYNERNSNNPAQAKVSGHIAATGLFLYQFRLFKKEGLLRYQASVPLMGALFSPEYGESYYEIFGLNHKGHHICLATPFNALSLRQTLSVDFPIKKTTVRVSYIGDFQQANVNNLKSHVWSNAFMIGYVKSFQLP